MTWWIDDNGNHPNPITQVNVENDTFTFKEILSDRPKYTGRTNELGARDRTMKYIKELLARGRYPHTVWPEHCIIGDEGHNIDPVLSAAVHEWERKRLARTNVVTKGSNPWTEHFSAVMAEVPDPEDPSTQINRPLINIIEQADVVVWMGEALSHCLANTFRDMVANFSDPSFVKKMVICSDATSSVGGFEKVGDAFLADVQNMGARVAKTTDLFN